MANRAAQFTQAEITRAIKAAQAAGLTVYECIATRQGVRIVTKPDGREAPATNPWDRFLKDGTAK